MLRLDNLESITKPRKRVGRGGSRGGTSGRGHKGQRARSGGKKGLSTFEGGQMALSRRIPRRGFSHVKNIEFELVNIKALETAFAVDSVVTRTELIASGLVKGKRGTKIKLLAQGSLTKSISITVDAASEAAQEAVTKAGGTLSLIGG